MSQAPLWRNRTMTTTLTWGKSQGAEDRLRPLNPDTARVTVIPSS